MSNRSNGPKNTVEVLNINSDYHPVLGERLFRVDIGKQVSVSKSTPSTMAPFPQPNIPSLKYSLTIYIPESEWKFQYIPGQKYDLTMNGSGDLTLRKIEKA